MGILARLFPAAVEPARIEPVLAAPQAPAAGPKLMARPQAAMSLDDPAFLEYIRSGSAAGSTVTTEGALNNSTVLRCVDLVSSAIGALPLTMQKLNAATGERTALTSHPLYRIFMFRPNPWQTAFEFKQLMQLKLLMTGNAYARIVRTGNRVSSLIPLTGTVQVVQANDGTLTYKAQMRANSDSITLPADEVLHLRSLSLDGISGISRVQKAAEVINTAANAQRAADRIFSQGVMAGGYLKHKGQLGLEATARLRAQMQSTMVGPDNAGKWFLLEEGMEPHQLEVSAQASQMNETRAAQVEEIGRVFGVPRPFLFVDDTSWGSGVEQLAILFVRFGLAPWFKVWEDAIQRSLLPESEWGQVAADFDERELLRGTLKDQGDFFAKASGAGGHKPWMEANEIRALSGVGPHKDGFGLDPAGGKNVAS